MSEKILSVSHEIDVDLASSTKQDQTYVRVYNTIFTSGIVKEIGTSGLTTLIALASFVDREGHCYPTQQQIADRIGCHKNTANKYVNDLLAVRIDGKPVVSRRKFNMGQGKIYSFYKIHALTDFNHVSPSEKSLLGVVETTLMPSVIPENAEFESEEEKAFNGPEAVKYFCQVYREVYGTDFVVGNWAQAGKLLRDKVVTPHPSIAKELIATAVREYDAKYKSTRFPRPTINMFSWMTNSLVESIESNAELSETLQAADKREAEAEAAMLAKLGKLGV